MNKDIRQLLLNTAIKSIEKQNATLKMILKAKDELTEEQKKLLEEVDKIEYQYYGDEGDIKKPQDSPINNEPTNSLDNKPKETDKEDNGTKDKPKKDKLTDWQERTLNLIKEANGR